MRRVLTILAVVAVAAIVVIGLTQTGGSKSDGGPGYDLSEAKQRLQGAPAPLAELHTQASTLIGGGKPAFEQRLASLKGHPVVINKWASWCAPCQAEFGVFESVGTERGKEIAFVGVNARDKRPAAERFIARYPVPYPSYEDPDEAIARAMKAPSNFPVTLFVDAQGKTVFTHQGGYRSAADLTADIDEHLGS